MNVCKKNVVLPREWAGIVISIWSEPWNATITILITIPAHSLGNTTFFLHTFIINLHSPFFFILTHLYSYFVILFYPLKTVVQTVESSYFLNIFSQRSSLKFLICLTLATVLQYFYAHYCSVGITMYIILCTHPVRVAKTVVNTKQRLALFILAHHCHGQHCLHHGSQHWHNHRH